jgi:hypothetical protein
MAAPDVCKMCWGACKLPRSVAGGMLHFPAEVGGVVAVGSASLAIAHKVIRKAGHLKDHLAHTGTG